MSLLVHTFLRGGDGNHELLDDAEDGSDLAGFENWRRTVWGGDGARALGARFFPQLDGGDLTVEPADVPAFLVECDLLRDHLDQVVPHPNPSRPGDSRAQTTEVVAARLANIRRAAERALAVGGGVLIW
ncbi:hypothetical protein [Kribbella endophytica]